MTARARPARPRGVRTFAGAALLVVLAGCWGSERDLVIDESSTPDPGDPPNATETNFFRLPCEEDSDCLPGEVCVLPDDAPADGEPPAGRCVDDTDG